MVFAHAGHILIDGPLFLGPVVVLSLALWRSSRRERQREERERASTRD
jgi:hypothetical protein